MFRTAFIKGPDAWLPTHVKRLDSPDDLLSAEVTLESRLRRGDHLLCVAGDVLPRDGFAVAGSAWVVEPNAANASMVRAPGVGPAFLKAGTVVRSDYLVVRLT